MTIVGLRGRMRGVLVGLHGAIGSIAMIFSNGVVHAGCACWARVGRRCTGGVQWCRWWALLRLAWPRCMEYSPSSLHLKWAAQSTFVGGVLLGAHTRTRTHHANRVSQWLHCYVV